MGRPSYTRFVVDRNVAMRCVPVVREGSEGTNKLEKSNRGSFEGGHSTAETEEIVIKTQQG